MPVGSASATCLHTILCILDFVAISMSTHGKMAEYVDHLQEHLYTQLLKIVKNARYTAPTVPGLGCDMLSSSLEEFEYLDRRYWSSGVGLEHGKLAFQWDQNDEIRLVKSPCTA